MRTAGFEETLLSTKLYDDRNWKIIILTAVLLGLRREMCSFDSSGMEEDRVLRRHIYVE
jgi:hypothetical protein